MPVHSTAGGGGLSMLMYASDETIASTTQTVYVLAKHFYFLRIPDYTEDWNKLLFVIYASNDTAGKNTYIAIYIEGVKEIELTFPHYEIGGVTAFARQLAELDISGWIAESVHIELKIKVDSGSTAQQWAWETWRSV